MVLPGMAWVGVRDNEFLVISLLIDRGVGQAIPLYILNQGKERS